MSDLTSAVDYTSFANSASTGFGRCDDSLASLYDFGPQKSLHFMSKKRKKHAKEYRRDDANFRSEAKLKAKVFKSPSQSESFGNYKRSFGNQLKNLSSKYKSEKLNLLFKNQSHAALKQPFQEDREASRNIYEQQEGPNPRFPSPSHKSTVSEHWFRKSRNKSNPFSKKRPNVNLQKVESTYNSNLNSLYHNIEIEKNSKYVSRRKGNKDFQRPIININLGNQPVENLKIVSVPNEKGISKEAMTIQVSYTPSGSQVNSKLDNLLSLENSKEGFGRNFNRRKSGNIVKSILSKRKKKNDPSREFVIMGKGEVKTYGNSNRTNNEALTGFEDVDNSAHHFNKRQSFQEHYNRIKEEKGRQKAILIGRVGIAEYGRQQLFGSLPHRANGSTRR